MATTPASRAASAVAPDSTTRGTPPGSCCTSTSVHSMPRRHGVPSDLKTASLAAHRAANCSVARRRDWQSRISRAVYTRARNVSPCCSIIRPTRRHSTISVPTPTTSIRCCLRPTLPKSLRQIAPSQHHLVAARLEQNALARLFLALLQLLRHVLLRLLAPLRLRQKGKHVRRFRRHELRLRVLL